jgi:hypothetical protein
VKAFVAIVVAFTLLLPMTGCAIYDGWFLQAEYQIKFVTPDGRPIDGVQLEVLDESGNISYGYPVTDYYEGGIPTSDANGIITFHHVLYFSDWGGMFFFGCNKGSPPPEFDLLFTQNGKLIYDTKYVVLNRKADSEATATVTRKVSVYDWDSAYAAARSDISEPPRIVEESLEFYVLEQTVVVENW